MAVRRAYASGCGPNGRRGKARARAFSGGLGACRYRGDYLGVYGSFLQLSLRHIAEADWSGRIPEYSLKHFRLEINKRCGSRRSARRNAAHHDPSWHRTTATWHGVSTPEYNLKSIEIDSRCGAVADASRARAAHAAASERTALPPLTLRLVSSASQDRRRVSAAGCGSTCPLRPHARSRAVAATLAALSIRACTCLAMLRARVQTRAPMIKAGALARFAARRPEP